MIVVRNPRLSDCETWCDDPFGPLYESLDEERPG